MKCDAAPQTSLLSLVVGIRGTRCKNGARPQSMNCSGVSACVCVSVSVRVCASVSVCRGGRGCKPNP